MKIDEEALMREFLKRMTLDIVSKDEYILSKALKRLYGNSINSDEFVSKIKEAYFDREYQKFVEEVKRVEMEYVPGTDLTEKQAYYLSATALAVTLLDGKPAPASLIFEVLRCVGMEDEKNFSNRYYFLKQLEKKGYLTKVEVANSKAEYCYTLTEEGEDAAKNLSAFEKLVELKEKISNNNRVSKIVERYVGVDNTPKLPDILSTSKIIEESSDEVRIELFGREFVKLSREEIGRFDGVARNLEEFLQSDLRKATNSRAKAQAYIVYAYNKGWIEIAGSGGKKNSIVFKYAKGKV